MKIALLLCMLANEINFEEKDSENQQKLKYGSNHFMDKALPELKCCNK